MQPEVARLLKIEQETIHAFQGKSWPSPRSVLSKPLEVAALDEAFPWPSCDGLRSLAGLGEDAADAGLVSHV
jgi:hypothetical protein